MKKLLIASNVLLLAIILFQARSQEGKASDKDSIETAVYDQMVKKCQWNSCKDYSGVPLEGIIRGDLITKMSRAYASDPGKALVNYNQPGAHGEDALSLCFDLEKIKNFIWHMEHAMCNAGCDSSRELGIRFYYIKYDTTGLAILSPSLKHLIVAGGNVNKHSLVMVPAYKHANYWYDFDYSRVKPGCKFDNPSVGAQFRTAGFVNPSSGDNHGGIGPPPKPGTYPTSGH